MRFTPATARCVCASVLAPLITAGSPSPLISASVSNRWYSTVSHGSSAAAAVSSIEVLLVTMGQKAVPPCADQKSHFTPVFCSKASCFSLAWACGSACFQNVFMQPSWNRKGPHRWGPVG